MTEKRLRSTAYRGFFIEVVRKDGLGICVYWQSLDGQVKRQAYDQGTEGAAIGHAKDSIDEYHKGIDRASYPVAGTRGRGR